MKLLWLCLVVIMCVLRPHPTQWVDPHSMDSKAKSKLPNYSQTADVVQNSDYCKKMQTCNSDVYLKRLVRLILSNTYVDEDDIMEEQFIGHLHMKLTSKEHEFLKRFSLSEESTEDSVKEVHSIFETSFYKTEQYKDAILSLQEQLFLIVFNPTCGALAATCLVLYITYKLLQAKFTWWLIFKYFLSLLYIIDFVITYLHIQHDTDIKHMVTIKKLGTYPPECDPNKMSWWTYFKTQINSAISENPCRAYYEATYYENLKYFIAPTKVLTYQFRTVLVEPVGDIGEAFGKFGRGMFTSLPWGLNVVLFPIMIVASLAVIFMVFLFIVRPHFRLSLFHLFTIELGEPARNQVDRRPIEFSGKEAIRGNGNNGRESEPVANYNHIQGSGNNEQRPEHRPLLEDVPNYSSSNNTAPEEQIVYAVAPREGQTSINYEVVAESSAN